MLQDRQDRLVRNAAEAAVRKDGANGFALFSCAAFERVNHSERGFAFAEIAGDRFAQCGLFGGQVKNIVHDLKGEAEVAAVFAKLLFDLLGSVGNRRAELHGDAEERGRLAEDEVEVLFLIDKATELLDLE